MKSPYSVIKLLIPVIIYFLPFCFIFLIPEPLLSRLLILLLTGLALINTFIILSSFSKITNKNCLALNARSSTEKLLGLSILFLFLAAIVYLSLSITKLDAFRESHSESFMILLITAVCLLEFIRFKFQPIKLSCENNNLCVLGYIPFLPFIKIKIPAKFIAVSLHEYETVYTSRRANVYNIHKVELQLSYRNKKDKFKTLELPVGTSNQNADNFARIKSFLTEHKINFSHSFENPSSEQNLHKKTV